MLSFTAGEATCKLGYEDLTYEAESAKCHKDGLDYTLLSSSTTLDVSFDTEFLIDLDNFYCKRQGECQTRTLSIDASAYAAASDKRTTGGIYTCSLNLPDGTYSTLVYS